METQNNVQPSEQQTKDFTKNRITQSSKHHLVFGLVSTLILVLGMGTVYLWQHQKLNDLIIKDAAISKDYLEAIAALPNIVVDSANSPTDLIAFLGSDNTQCYKLNGNGYYKVVAQEGDKFAEMQYGCTANEGTAPIGDSPTHILAKKQGTSWSLISPTNQWQTINGQDVPSCIMVNDNMVSKLVTPVCWESSTLSSGNSSTQRTVIQVTNP